MNNSVIKLLYGTHQNLLFAKNSQTNKTVKYHATTKNVSKFWIGLLCVNAKGKLEKTNNWIGSKYNAILSRITEEGKNG